MFDVLAYSKYYGVWSTARIRRLVRDLILPDLIYYLPVMFSAENDGERLSDDESQRDVDLITLGYLDELCPVPWYKIDAETPDLRLNQILDILVNKGYIGGTANAQSLSASTTTDSDDILSDSDGGLI